MGFLDRLFGRGGAAAGPKPARQPNREKGEEVAAGIAREILSVNGTQEFGRVLGRHSPADLRALCEEFPIRTDLTNGLAMDNSFQAATFVARLLGDYDGYARQYGFPKAKVDAPALSRALVSRILQHAQHYRGKMAPLYMEQIYDLAIELLQSKPPRNEEALVLLESSLPGIRGDHAFWVFACKYNIAQRTKAPADIASAVQTGRDLLSGAIKVSAAKLDGVRELMGELEKLSG